MKSKFLITIFACALISTPKAESKITLKDTLLCISIPHTGVTSLATIAALKDGREKQAIECALICLTSALTSYCFYKKNEYNNVATMANAIVTVFYIKKIIDFKFRNKSSVFFALYHALTAYQLNK